MFRIFINHVPLSDLLWFIWCLLSGFASGFMIYGVNRYIAEDQAIRESNLAKFRARIAKKRV